MAIQHDDHPSEITWDLANEEGEIVLSGKYYLDICAESMTTPDVCNNLF